MGTTFSCKRLRADPSCLWEKYVLDGKRSSRCSHRATLRWHGGKLGPAECLSAPGGGGRRRRMPVGSGGTPWGVSGPVWVLTPRRSGTTGQGAAALHEVRTDCVASWLLRVLRVMASETRVGRDARAPGSLDRVAEGSRLVALVAFGVYCTRVGCYWLAFGCTPRRSGSRAVRTTPGQYNPTLVE